MAHLAVGEVHRLPARARDHREQEAHLVGHARGDHPQWQGRRRAGGGHAHGRHPVDALARSQPQRDEVHAQADVVVDDGLDRLRHAVAVRAEPVAQRHRVFTPEHHGLVGAHHLLLQYHHARVGGGARGRVLPRAPRRPRVGLEVVVARTARARRRRSVQHRRREVVERRQEAVVRELDAHLGPVADREDPRELVGPTAVAELVPQHGALGRDRQRHAVVGHDLHGTRRREAPPARARLDRARRHRSAHGQGGCPECPALHRRLSVRAGAHRETRDARATLPRLCQRRHTPRPHENTAVRARSRCASGCASQPPARAWARVVTRLIGWSSQPWAPKRTRATCQKSFSSTPRSPLRSRS